MTEPIISTRYDHVLHLLLNSPNNHNAVGEGIMNGLVQQAKALMEPGDIRAVVISGAGKSFCSGIDLSFFGDMASGALSAASASDAFANISPAGANFAQQLGWLWQEVPIPVIAAIQGAALGGGLNLALGADIRIASPDAKIGHVEINWGMIPDMSASQALRHLLPLDVLKEIVLTGKKLTGIEAKELGLVTQLSNDPLETALEMAQSIASKNPEAVRAAKHLFNSMQNLSERDGLALEAHYSSKLMGSPNQIEAVMASMEKRLPKYSDPS